MDATTRLAATQPDSADIDRTAAAHHREVVPLPVTEAAAVNSLTLLGGGMTRGQRACSVGVHSARGANKVT